ncbi:NADP-dependent oxidoreductase [Duganella callida]|uniref:NADP-dependent oxidoreductase n=1 Tax=Duganella callida TaxID=2561932 RepID=A0A4Y9SJM1_9BURK|nr:NADP-dependent oxidoreductase [Duganella callida]TFW26532.1 NADP-dependent oxidoreductase [Duganella callida]
MSTQTMKAVRLHTYGGPEVLRYEDAPKPAPQPGEVLVRVHAVGINPPDWYLRDGYSTLPADWRPQVALPAIPGSDISGVVAAVGAGVTAFAEGDEVFGMVRFPSFGESAAYAEYVAAPVGDLARKPVTVSHTIAAAAPMALLTAWQFLIELGHDAPNPFQAVPHRPVPLAGRTVLINGAAGGVGHLAVQLAKWRGAQVIAVASGSHEAFLKDLGADQFIDYTTTDVAEMVRDIDLVLDTFGGPATARFLRTLKRGGALFPVYPLGFADQEAADKLGVTVTSTQVRSSGAQLTRLASLLDEGVIRVAIDSSYPLADARAAHQRAAGGHIRGKIVLTVQP